jgi:hypothetical protein
MFAASKSGSAADPTDAQFNYVTMLLHGDGTNGAQNNTFLDSSTNNFTITRNGNTTQGTFTPYGSNWSNYFDGSSNLQISNNSAFQFGTGDFTIEFWLCYTGSSWTGSNQSIASQIASDTVTGWGLFRDNAGTGIGARLGSNISNYITLFTGSIPATGVWEHYALVRNGATVTWYKNGTNVASTSAPAGNITDTSQPFYVSNTQWGAKLTNGYISNLRVVKGTAVYTTTFTPSTTPLTAITNTSVLTCQNNRFSDSSANAFAITATGSPSVQRFSPFSPTSAYSTSVIGGSGYFDGTTDYLTIANNTALQFGSGNFTVEGFFYSTTANTTQQSLFSIGSYDSGILLRIGTHPGGDSFYINGTYYNWSPITYFISNIWNHLAVVRTSTTVAIFVNGTRIFNTTNSATISQTTATNIGTSTHDLPQSPFLGYISQIRLIKGTGPYDATSSTLTVPTAPLTAVSGTSLLLLTTNAGILDNAMMNNLETVGNAQISTSVKKYGTGSMYFDGTGDWLMTPNRTNLNVGSGDFTVEAWVYTGSSSQQVIIGANRNSDGVGAFMLNLNYTGKVRFFCSYSGGTMLDYNVGSGTISDSAWHHIAATRSGSSLRIFIDGTQTGTTNTTLGTASIDNAIADYRVGSTTDGALNFNGYIDDLRITKGYARYTANFTAPTAAFADKG